VSWRTASACSSTSLCATGRVSSWLASCDLACPAALPAQARSGADRRIGAGNWLNSISSSQAGEGTAPRPGRHWLTPNAQTPALAHPTGVTSLPGLVRGSPSWLGVSRDVDQRLNLESQSTGHGPFPSFGTGLFRVSGRAFPESFSVLVERSTRIEHMYLWGGLR
jgi:hypothetical protein